MNIISLINEFTNTFNKTFTNNLNPLNLESKVRDVGDSFTINLYESFLNYIDEQFKNSKETKEYFVPLRDILYLKPYQRLTNETEYQTINIY